MREYTYNEIKESRLFMDKRPPSFGVIITFITLIFVAGIVCLAGFSVKTYVVKASAITTSENKAYIMNNVAGNVKSVDVIEGQSVKAGDILITLDDTNMILQINQIQSTLDYIQSKKGLIEKLILFINNFSISDENFKVNPFDSTSVSEAKQYGEAKQFIDYVVTQIEASEEPDAEEFTQSNIDELKSQFLSQHYSDLISYESQEIEAISNIEMYTQTLEEYIVRAKIDGIVHFNAAISIGTVIQAGSMIGSISDSDNSKLYFNTVLSASDRSKVNVGDSVEIALSGVAQNEFGVLIGEVIEIANDSIQTENGEVFYTVKIKSNTTFLQNNNDNKIDLTNGMIGESRIKYDETTWLKWAIEQIGVKFR